MQRFALLLYIASWSCKISNVLQNKHCWCWCLASSEAPAVNELYEWILAPPKVAWIVGPLNRLAHPIYRPHSQLPLLEALTRLLGECVKRSLNALDYTTYMRFNSMVYVCTTNTSTGKPQNTLRGSKVCSIYIIRHMCIHLVSTDKSASEPTDQTRDWARNRPAVWYDRQVCRSIYICFL